MKICFPTMGRGGLEETIGRIYDRVWTYTIVDTETSEVEIVQAGELSQCGLDNLPRILALKGVTAFLVLKMTPNIRSRFENGGIMVYMGANGTVREALGRFHSGRLIRDSEDITTDGYDIRHAGDCSISQISD